MIENLEERLLSIVHGEFSSIDINYNNYACNDISVKEAIEHGDYDWGDWVNQEEKEKAILTNRVWAVRWYPLTPVGFYAVFASSLNVAIEKAIALGEKND